MSDDPLGSEKSTISAQRRRELADFLRTRREKIKPKRTLSADFSRRRTPGLRREEVAELAGVGTTWYTWLEQARDIQPSVEVLRKLAQALEMTPAETKHLFALAGKGAPTEIENTHSEPVQSIHRFLDSALQVPAIFLGPRWELLGANLKARELFWDIANCEKTHGNWLRHAFSSQKYLKSPTRELIGRTLVSEFRAGLGEAVDQPWAIELIEAIKSESHDFAKLWSEQDVSDAHSIKVLLEVRDQGFVEFERLVLRIGASPLSRIVVFNPMN